MNHKRSQNQNTDPFTRELIDSLFSPSDQKIPETPKVSEKHTLDTLLKAAENTELTAPIIDLFVRLKKVKKDLDI
ncbi:MAG: hypothetical protein P8012_02685, partial [Desulfobacterales bacterium]